MAKTKNISSINAIKAKLKKALEDQGSYTEGMDALIETTAGNIRAFHLAVRDIEGLKTSFVKEMTREGNIKLVPHPAIKVIRDQSEMIRKLLRELRLTISTVEGAGDDEMDDLINSVNEIEE